MKNSDTRAERFVSARSAGLGLQTYPGEMPHSLDEAYGIQDAAIELWEDTLTGWKVGGINGDWPQKLGVRRLAGPVFKRATYSDSGTQLAMPVFADGFAAVEGEVTAVLAKDAPADKMNYTIEEILELIGALHIGVEVASSPFPGINEHGPLVTISDFGNNYGLVLGAEIPSWRDLTYDQWTFSTAINGREVGRATPAGIPGGPVDSVRFLLENVARRGRPAKAGMMILTSAVTGVHRVFAGDEAMVSMNGSTPIRCRFIPARPAEVSK